VSIVRVGLAETKKFADGYEAIFGKKNKGAAPPTATAAKKAGTKKPAAKPKPAGKKAPAKKTTKKK
jgi:hypothetical protein